MNKRIFKNNFIYFFAIIISLFNMILMVDARRLFQFENIFDYIFTIFFLLNITTLFLLILNSKKSVVTFIITNLISLVLVIKSFYQALEFLEENLVVRLKIVTLLFFLFYVTAMILVKKYAIKKDELLLNQK